MNVQSPHRKKFVEFNSYIRLKNVLNNIHHNAHKLNQKSNQKKKKKSKTNFNRRCVTVTYVFARNPHRSFFGKNIKIFMLIKAKINLK